MRLVGQASHLAAAAGVLFGNGLYVLNIVAVAPATGLARDEWQAPACLMAQRLVMHILFGMATAMAAAALLRRKAGPPPVAS